MDAGPWFCQSPLIDEEKMPSFEDRIARILSQRNHSVDSLEIKKSYLLEMVVRFSFVKFCIANNEYDNAEKEMMNVKNLTAFVESAVTAESCQALLERIENLKSATFHAKPQDD